MLSSFSTSSGCIVQLFHKFWFIHSWGVAHIYETYGQTDRQEDGQIYGQTGRWTDIWTDRQQTDRWTDLWTEGQTYGQTDGRSVGIITREQVIRYINLYN